MNTVLLPTGQIALPNFVLERLGLFPGDEIELEIDDEETVTLRKTPRIDNGEWVDLLLACPHPFEVPEREKDDTKPLEL